MLSTQLSCVWTYLLDTIGLMLAKCFDERHVERLIQKLMAEVLLEDTIDAVS